MAKKIIEFLDNGKIFFVETVNRRRQRREINKDDVMDLIRIKKKEIEENKILLELTDYEIKVITIENGIRSIKYIEPNSLLDILSASIKDKIKVRPLGRLPKQLVHISFEEPGNIQKVLIYEKGGFGEFKTPNNTFKNIEFPSMLFLFIVNKDRVGMTYMACVKEDYENLRDTTKLYFYPYAHVSYDFSVCLGSIQFPNINSLHQLNSYPFIFRDSYHILSHAPGPNAVNLTLKELLNKVESKEVSINDVLRESSFTLQNFINRYM